MIALDRLKTELAAAGITVSSLGMVAKGEEVEVYTYDQDGTPVPLPPGAAAVVAAHVPTPTPTPPDYGADAPPDYAAKLASAVTNLRAYLGLASPTGQQTVGALKLVIRLVLVLARRSL